MNYELESLAVGKVRKLLSRGLGKKGVSFLTILSVVMSISAPFALYPSVASAVAPLPDLVVSKTNDASVTIAVGDSFNWIISITNDGVQFANFTASTQVVIKDELPTTGATYGIPTVSQTSGVDGTLDCDITSNVLSCVPGTSAYKIPETDSVTITIPVTVTSAGTLTNPKSGGVCAVDSDTPDNVDEIDESNNNCNLGSSDSVVIEGTPVTASITAENKVYDGTATAITSCSLTGVVVPDVVTCSATASNFDTRNVGTGKTVTATGITLSGADAGEYTLTSTTATTTADITARPITVTAVTDTKVFDGNTSSAGVPTITVGTLASGDTATWTQTFDTADIGTGKTLTPSGAIVDSGAVNVDANYTVTFVADTTGVITDKQVPDITWSNPADIVYGTPLSATQLNATSSVAGTFAYTPDTGAILNAGAAQVLSTNFTPTDTANYSTATATVLINVTKATLTVSGITADNKVYDGTTAETLNTGAAVLVGIVGSDDVSLDSSAVVGVFADKNVETGKTVTISGLTLTGTAAGNYELTQPTTTADITARTITVSAVTDTKVYDGNTSSDGVPTITVGTLASGDTATWTQTFDTADIGTGKTLTPAGTIIDSDLVNVDANYTVTFVADTTGVITAAPVDTDDDGINDDVDNCPYVSNPLQTDTDDDGIGDACDTDDDGDGQTDADETTCGSDPLNAQSESLDTDNDNIPDCVDPDDDNDLFADEAPDPDGEGPILPGPDNCRLVANFDQADADDDNIGDVCDNSTDSDGDTIPDSSDNCLSVANTNQTDTDGDGMGNACDPDDDNDTIADLAGDPDGEGPILSGPDNCPLNANTNQADNDEDGIGNVCDSTPDGNPSGGGGGGSSSSGSSTLFIITSSADFGGTVTPLGSYYTPYGSNYGVSVIPASGFQIANVLVDGISVGPVASYTFTNVTASHTVSASFQAVAGASTTEPYYPGDSSYNPSAYTPPISYNPSIGTGGATDTNSEVLGTEEETGDQTSTEPEISESEPLVQPAALSGAGGLGPIWNWLKMNWPWWVILLIILLFLYWWFTDVQRRKREQQLPPK